VSGHPHFSRHATPALTSRSGSQTEPIFKIICYLSTVYRNYQPTGADFAF
jgi:hypothetical protein